MGVSGQQHAPAALYPRERPGTHCTGGWVGPRAGLDGRKNLVPTGIRSRTVQLVAQSLYLLSCRVWHFRYAVLNMGRFKGLRDRGREKITALFSLNPD